MWFGKSFWCRETNLRLPAAKCVESGPVKPGNRLVTAGNFFEFVRCKNPAGILETVRGSFLGKLHDDFGDVLTVGLHQPGSRLQSRRFVACKRGCRIRLVGKCLYQCSGIENTNSNGMKTRVNARRWRAIVLGNSLRACLKKEKRIKRLI